MKQKLKGIQIKEPIYDKLMEYSKELEEKNNFEVKFSMNDTIRELLNMKESKNEHLEDRLEELLQRVIKDTEKNN